jgi:hypothetical protein
MVTSGGTSTITFSSIPATFTHLQLRYLAQDNRATYGISDIGISFNSDTTAGHYVAHSLYGDGATATAAGYTSGYTYAYLGVGTLGTTTGGTFGVGVVDILDYASANKNKTIKSLSGVDINGTIAGFGGRVGITSGLWMATSLAAISSMTITSLNGNFQNYSSFALYGVK